ncbi:MAG: thioredoxin family protein [Verrucomicrobia bacterium]|nr:thioredoxin family protein [Verrucomicrobiota bacterium]
MLVLCSCGVRKQDEKKSEASPSGASGIPPQLRAKQDAAGGAPVVPGGNAAPAAATSGLTPESEIVFTNPDDPDAEIPELSKLLAETPKRRGPWEVSESIAKRRALREGKPLLVWFTDSAQSPMCKALSQELFSTPDFEKWAGEKLVRLRVDANVKIEDENLGLDEKETMRVDMKNHVAKLKKQYRVLGHPSVLMLGPGGEIIGRYRGYKRGEADYLWGQIKHAEAVATDTRRQWRADLEAKGYREWKDRSGRSVFAKLTGYANGNLTLIEPDGTRSRTREDRLSDSDRTWIADQKKLRGM